MNYKLHYEKLISKAQNRSILKSEYKEIHHIIPKCMGGLDDKENLVSLFPEEHLIAHLLLVKIYPNDDGLIHAAFRMSKYKQLSNKEYAWLREKYSNSLKKTMKNNKHCVGRVLTEETKLKMSKARKGIAKEKTIVCEECNELVTPQTYHRYHGSKCGQSHKKVKICEYCKNEIDFMNYSQFHGEFCKDNPNRKDKPKKKILKVKCPHCGKEGGGGNMTRYHLDKCKFREDKPLLN